MNKSVAGLTQCLDNGLFHNWNDHSNEVDTCDHCGQFTECIVNCQNPKVLNCPERVWDVKRLMPSALKC